MMTILFLCGDVSSDLVEQESRHPRVCEHANNLKCVRTATFRELELLPST